MQLPPNFRQKDIWQIKRLIEDSTSFTVVGMPGMGISSFLKFLVSQDFAYFIHIDLYELPKLDKHNLFKLLALSLGVAQKNIKEKLLSLTQKHHRVVIVFNRFDQIKNEFNASFFSNLRSLIEVNKSKIVMVFSSNKPLYQWSPQAFARINLDTFSKHYYLKPYSNEEMIQLLNLYTPNLKLSKKLIEKYLLMSGGHFQLLQLLIKSERPHSPLLDNFVHLQVKRIYEESFTYKQKQQIQKIAFGKAVKEIDLYLIELGIVEKNRSEGYFLFSPIFTEYVKNTVATNLAPLENKLFILLHKNRNEVVVKEDIFNALWPNEPDKQSGWALNALVYRLRKNPAFIQKAYMIKSYKKLGYSLIN